MKYILIVITFLITSCASVPRNPNFQILKGETIGILVDIPENLIHTHIGTTVFNNFNKNYPYKWDLENYTTKKLTTSLESSGYRVINLNKTSVSYDDIKNMIIAKKDQWNVNSKNTEAYDALLKLGIKSVVYIKENKTVAYIQCGMYDCTDFYTESYGLFSRSFLGFKSFFAVAAFDTGIIITDPLAKLDYEAKKAIYLKNYAKPSDFKNISEQKWQPVKDKIFEYVDTITTNTPNLLKNIK